MSGRALGPAWRGTLLRAAVSVGLLATLAVVLDPVAIAGRLAGMAPVWVAAGLGLVTLQVGLSAWRWSFTARRLGLSLPLGEAVREYYLASILNQVLPGGVAGDVSRAWRHGRGPGSGGEVGRAVRAVVLERASGQAVMAATAAVSLAVLPLPWGSPLRELAPSTAGLAAVAGAATVVGAVAVAVAALRRRRIVRAGRPPGGRSSSDAPGPVVAPGSEPPGPPAPTLGGRIARDTYRALLTPRALAVQLPTSALVVGSYLLLGLVAARAVGVATPAVALVPLVAPVLLAMLVPVTVAGWGIREGAAALLWTAVGLPASDGVAVFVAYGLLVLGGSLPGVLLLPGILGPRGEPRAQAGPGSGAPGGASSSRSKRTSSPRAK